MMYLFFKLFFCLLIAFIFGGVMGWILPNMRMHKDGEL